MAQFHFFTDIDLLQAQTADQAFGPVAASPDTQYRVTSLHLAIGNPKVYAICDGLILVQQDDDDPNNVTLILKPIEQQTINYATIKYFIYRGVLKNSLFNGTEIAPSSTNDLTQSIWASQEAMNLVSGEVETPSINALGIHLSATNASPYQYLNEDELIKAFHQTEDFQLPLVRAGWHIGDFSTTSQFGVEIMVGGLGFEPVFEIVRKSQNTIVVPTLPSTPTQAEEFEYFYQKERILNYIDPVAFYGEFYHNGIQAKVNATDTNFTKIQGDDLLNLAIEKFHNKNLLYLDIRNEHNNSFNYYKNYNSGFEIAYDSAPLTNHNYQDGHNWPIFPILTNLFIGTAETGLLTLQLPKGDNGQPIIYLGQGNFKNSYPNTVQRIQKLEFDTSGSLTEVFELSVPRHSTGVIMPGYIVSVRSPTTPLGSLELASSCVGGVGPVVEWNAWASVA